jgi:hypothetical protein
MEEVATKQGIILREIVDETTIHKVDTRPLEKALEVIDLSKYGTGIKEILFIVVALAPGDTIHKDEVVYDRKKRKLTIETNLNYPLVLKGTPQEVLSMAAKLFVDWIGTYPQLKVQDFDFSEFKNDAVMILR